MNENITSLKTEACSDNNKTLWSKFCTCLKQKNFDEAIEFWEPQTRNIFRKNLKNFRRKQLHWKLVQYVTTTDDGYIIIKYTGPKGFLPKVCLIFNRYRAGQYSYCGRLISCSYDIVKKLRNNGYGFFRSICGVALKKFDVACREFKNETVIKKFSILQQEEKRFLGWSYSNSVASFSPAREYIFETFIIYSTSDCSDYLVMFHELDEFIRGVWNSIHKSIIRVNIYHRIQNDSKKKAVPKSAFVAPGNNDIFIYNASINLNVLKHEMLHCVIYSVTSAWPPLFFREGYADSYMINEKTKHFILNEHYPASFLQYDSLFFDYTEYPPMVSGLMVYYLIQEFGIERFYSAYKAAETMSVNKTLKYEYGLSITQLRKKTIHYLKQVL